MLHLRAFASHLQIFENCTFTLIVWVLVMKGVNIKIKWWDQNICPVPQHKTCIAQKLNAEWWLTKLWCLNNEESGIFCFSGTRASNKVLFDRFDKINLRSAKTNWTQCVSPRFLLNYLNPLTFNLKITFLMFHFEWFLLPYHFDKLSRRNRILQ